jgi:hypothetical protein
MRNIIFLLLLSPAVLFAQKHQITFSESRFFPIHQNASLEFSPYASGNIQLYASSYFSGLNYSFSPINKWAIKVGVMTGNEKYNISNYNALIDHAQHPELDSIYGNFKNTFKSAYISLGIEHNFQIKHWIDEISVSAAMYYNMIQQHDYIFEVKPIYLELDGQGAIYFNKSTVPTLDKPKYGFELGMSMRKNVYKGAFVEVGAKYQPSNQLSYTFDSYSSRRIPNGGGFSSTGTALQENTIKYGQLNIQLNVGVRF